MYAKINQLSFIIFTILYSLYGSPTTPKIGFLEIVLIILLIGTLSLSNIILYIKNNFRSKFLIFFGSIIIVGSIVAIINANPNIQVLRDFIFYGYISYFLYVLYLVEKNFFDIRLILFFNFFVAIVFLLRLFYISSSLDLYFDNLTIEKNYLIVNICMLYTACLLPIMIIHLLKENFLDKFFFILFSTFFIICFLYFTIKLGIRASFIVYLSLIFYFILFFLKRNYLNNEKKYKMLNFFYLIIFFIFIFIVIRLSLTEAITFKLKNNFLNNRLSEFISVNNNLTSLSEIILGKGMGSGILSKSTNGYSNFLHNFFLHFYYKHGLLGLIFSIILTYKIFIRIFNNIKLLNPMAIVGFFPILYGLMFSTSYKTLEFWMLLVLLIYNKNNKYYDK